ncbi:putative permease [Mucilaginibacter gracilis]|uniref:Putative permease n=1 Tax=Mucilaginibacter gracilis TaxID=423350 RepID=A0A495J9X1_9SPHI|nr:ABC transporter permease [Mucilaginibacter gracilis]RKR85725.1 putative permease [Mucilaginibacter gracilis]
MISNYIKIAIRNLLRNKVYSIINIAGLAVSIAACLLLYIIISYEMGYDTTQPNYNRIARIVTTDKFSDGISYSPGIPFPFTDAFRNDFPQIKCGALYCAFGSQVSVLKGDGKANQNFMENGVFYMEPQFFEVFTYKWLAGSANVLAEPNTAVLTKNMADKYFGNWKTAVGKFLKFDNSTTVRVAGILDDPSVHSDLPLQIMVSLITRKNNNKAQWADWHGLDGSYQMYLLLPAGVDATSVNKQLVTFNNKYLHTSFLSTRTNFLQPLQDVHFNTLFSNFGGHTTSRSKLTILGLIGFLIIIMAIINFVNLSTAKAVTRSKEIGVRKVLGGSRKQLFWQMMGETGIVVLISTALAIGIATLAIPYIKNVISIQESLNIFRLDIMMFVVAGFIIINFLAGVYPSLILSGFTPALALKNKITSATVGGILLRRGLVVTQFAASQMLIICTIIAISQMDFINNADLGFNKNGVLVLNSNNDSALLARQLNFKQKLLQLPGVQSVSFSSDVPSSENNWQSNFAYDHRPDEQFSAYLKFTDEDYFKTFGIKFIAGGPYSASDTMKEVVVNETMLKMLNVHNAQDAIGKQIHLGGKRHPWKTVVGVVKDFTNNSLRTTVKPLFMVSHRKEYNTTSIRFQSSNVKQTQSDIQSLWNKYFPEYAVTTSFFADNINDFYQQENQLSLMYKIAAGLAIFISCLGLYGLISFMTVQKTKEVGIRKVLGAGIGSIVYLFSKEFTFLICIAFAISAPIAFYFMHSWLSGFAFRINISISYFIIAIISSITIAWLTVGFQAFKAAMVKPIKSLRSE